MKYLKAKRHRMIYIIAVLLLVMTFILISNDRVFASLPDYSNAKQLKLNKEYKGTITEGDKLIYKFKTSSVKAIYKLSIRRLDNGCPHAELWDNTYDMLNWAVTGDDKSDSVVFDNLKKNTTHFVIIGYYNGEDGGSYRTKYVFSVKETITPPAKVVIKKATAGKKKLTVTWKPSPRAKKYQVAIRKGKGKWKTYTTSAKKKTIKKLKSKNKYSIRVRGFFKYKNKNRYGKWSKIKTVKVK